MLEEALRPFQIHLKPLGAIDNFQVSFQNFTVFKHFIDENLPPAKIMTKSPRTPFSIQFSIDCFAEGMQDEIFFNCFSEKLESIGIHLEYCFTTGIYQLEFPNVEFLFIFLVKTLQNLHR